MAQCVWNPIAGFLLEPESACQENQVLCLLGDRSSGKSKALEHLLCTSADGDHDFIPMVGWSPAVDIRCLS